MLDITSTIPMASSKINLLKRKNPKINTYAIKLDKKLYYKQLETRFYNTRLLLNDCLV